MDIKTCDNCGFSRLNPCPYLMKVTCGPSQKFVKWAPAIKKVAVPMDARTYGMHSTDEIDEIEEETLDIMKKRREKEKPARNFKILLFCMLVAAALVLIFGFKIVRFINHMVFGFIGLVIILSIAYSYIKSKRGKKDVDKRSS